MLKDMAERKSPILLKRGSGYVLEGRIRAEYDQKYGTQDITLNIRQKVKDLINKVPDVAEKDFMVEADICLRHDAGRATIIMVVERRFLSPLPVHPEASPCEVQRGLSEALQQEMAGRESADHRDVRRLLSGFEGVRRYRHLQAGADREPERCQDPE